MKTFYSEWDSHAAAWLRNLQSAGLIPEGHVDERDVRQLTAADLDGYDRVSLFAGIGGWERALELARWDAARPVWTVSCPCQPFSTAGKGEGTADERHLWPAVAALVRECRPLLLFGEQVASRAGYCWLDGVRLDLEAQGYAFGAADLPAAGCGAPHRRQRLWWVAHAPDGRRRAQQRAASAGREQPDAAGRGAAGGLGHAEGSERRLPVSERRSQQEGVESGGAGKTGDVGHADDAGQQGRSLPGSRRGDERTARSASGQPADREFWDAFDLLPCTDGKVRRTQPGLFPLVDGVPWRLADGTTGHGSRSKTLRGIGNAVVPSIAALFIRAYLDAEQDLYH